MTSKARQGLSMNYLKISILILSTVFFLIPSIVDCASAWGPMGHSIIGEIAQSKLLPGTKRIIREQLQTRSLANISNWADQVKKKRKQRPWHYTNIPEGILEYDPRRDCPTGNCVTEIIPEMAQTLAKPRASLKDRREALKYLAHFVGDIHQPLHLGYASDRGGNRISLRYRGRNTNLHALWDQGLIQRGRKSLVQYARRLNCRRTVSIRLKNLREEVIRWGLESRKIVLNSVYNFNEKSGLSPNYIARSRVILNRRMCKAGTRLAGILNQVFASK
jgi:nuclease S1